jgi:hypothetical protein
LLRSYTLGIHDIQAFTDKALQQFREMSHSGMFVYKGISSDDANTRKPNSNDSEHSAETPLAPTTKHQQLGADDHESFVKVSARMGTGMFLGGVCVFCSLTWH